MFLVQGMGCFDLSWKISDNLQKEKMIVFDEIPHSSLPVYNIQPDMCLDETFKPALLKPGCFPPRVEMSKTFSMTDIRSALSSKEGILADKAIREDINRIANGFIEGNMKTVVVSIYPKCAVSHDGKEAVLVQDFSMVAFEDEIEYEL